MDILVLKKIIPYVKPYKGHIIGNIVFNILYALLSALSYIALVPMLQVLFNKTKKVTTKPVYTSIFEIKDYAEQLLYYKLGSLAENQEATLALLIVVSLVIITFLFKNLFGFLGSYHMIYLRNGVMKDMRGTMFKKVISLPIAFYSEKRKGDVMARMLGDLGEVQNSFFAILELIVREPMTIIFSIAIMLTISVKLTLFVFVFIPIAGFIISRIGKSLKSKSLRAQQESGYFISIVEETLSGLKVVKSFNAESNFSKKFNGSIGRLYKLSNSIGKKNSLASPMSELLGIITIAVILWYGGQMVLVDKSLTGELFLAYMGLAYNILTPAKAISKASYAVKNGIAAAERVFEVLEQESSIVEKPNAIAKNDFSKGLTIENVEFKYESDPVLKDFSINVPKGQTVALVGQSGSGKSTVANLVTRFYDVNKGAIKIDGTDIKDLKLHSLRGLLGLVTQDSILFNDSIKNNILLGKEGATDDEIIEALKIANAWEFVKDLPEGINTNVGDAGNKLSGGQKQRLSIARAVLKNPPIMVLDEATSALDTESERLVQDALENMMKNRTSIVIAHRLSTIQNADNIVVMHKGRIIEQGKHQELIAKNGTYKKLVDMQSLDKVS